MFRSYDFELFKYWEKGRIILDFIPNFKFQDFKSQKQISTIIPLPKKFILEFLQSVELKDKAMNRLSESEISKLKTLKNYLFSPAGNFGYSKAEITKGGILTDEINSDNLESKLQKNLFFLGEALNVSGELGGFNFHFAFASAIKFAKHYL